MELWMETWEAMEYLWVAERVMVLIWGKEGAGGGGYAVSRMDVRLIE